MSGAQTSTFAPPNVLLNTLSGAQTAEVQQNQLMNQQKTQAISAENMAQVGRAAAGLLSAYPDEASRAAAYPPVVGLLQSLGYAKNAPAQYPGEGTLRAIVNASVSPADQYKMGLITSPQAQANFNAVFGAGSTGTGTTAAPATTGTPTTGTAAPSLSIPARGTGGPGASASAPTEWLPYFEEASQKTGIPVDLLVAQARQESGFNPNATGQAGEIGAFQIKPSTAQSPGFGMAGVDPASIAGPDNVRNNIMFGAQYLKARMGSGDPTNPAVQAAGLHAYNGGGDPNYVANVFRYRPTLAPSDPNAAVTSYTPPTAGATTATAPAGGGGTPAPYQTASTAPTAPPGSTAAPAAASPAPDTPWDLPGAPAPDLPPPSTPTAAPAPAAPAAAPALGPAPTQPSGTGSASPQFQQAMQLKRQAAMLASGPGGQLPQNQAMAKYLDDKGNALLKVDTFQDLGGGLQRNTLTNEVKYGGPPTARSTTDNAGNTWILQPGQPPALLHANVSGVTGSGTEASAMRTLNEIAPKIANGTATPQEQANYATAAETYQQPQVHEDPNTHALVRVPTRELPAGFPPSPFAGNAGGAAQPLTPGMSKAQSGAETKLGEDYATTDKKSYDAANASLGMLVNANNAAEVLNQTPGGFTATGTGANTRLEIAKTLNTVSGLFGGGPLVDPSKISAWEALNKQTRLMGMQVVNNYFGGSREAASIINGATTAVPNSENSYLGFRLVSSGIEQDLLRQRELYEFKGQQLAAGQPMATAEAAFNRANPVQNYTARAIANAVPDDIAAHLVANPDTVRAFDQHFGPGIGEFILKGGRTGMGRAGVPSNG